MTEHWTGERWTGHYPTAGLQGRRILLLAFDLLGSPGGIARHGRSVAHALLDAGCSLSIVVLNDPAERAPHMRHMFAAAEYLGCGGSKRRFVAAACASALAGVDLVVLEHPHIAPIGWVVARARRTRMVVFVHGIDVWTSLRPVRRWTLRHADLVLCVSRTTQQRAIAAGNVVSSKTSVLFNCLDPSIQLEAQARKTHGPPSMLTVARIDVDDWYKGHRQVIESVPSLLIGFPDLTYDIVGDGNGRPELEDLANRLGVGKAIRFHGMVSDEELAECYARASFFIMPSQSEGFGYVFLEAMAHGLPAIGGNMDASTEVIVDEETGLLVDPTSVDAVRAAAERMLADAALRTRMGQASARRVERYFMFSNFREELIRRLTALDSPGTGRRRDRVAAAR